MRLRGLAGVLGLLIAGGAFAAPAQANTFCVEKPKCVQDGGTAAPNIQAAFNAAGSNGGGLDRVELGGKTFNTGPYTAVSGDPVKVVGSGTGKTILTRTVTTSSQTILNLGDPGSSARELQVLINNGASVRGIQTPGKLSRIYVKGQSAGPGQSGVYLDAGGTMSKSKVSLPTNASALAGGMNGPDVTVRESTLRGTTGLVAAGAGDRAIRVSIQASSNGFGASGASVVLDQAKIEMLGSGPGQAFFVSGVTDTTKLTARHVTAIGSGQGGTSGASATATGIVGTCPTAELVMRNTILRNFEHDLFRSATSVTCSGVSQAFIRPAYSVFDPASALESGAGLIENGKGNRNVYPRFVQPSHGNYHLRASSPVIDKGEPGKPTGSQSKVDLDGHRRVIDGDGDGKARRDIGAFEFSP